jgi:N-acetylglucosamine-6-phosphate deacetylase
MSDDADGLLISGGVSAAGEAISVLLRGERVVAVGTHGDDLAAAGARTLDAEGLIVAPGFIDLQVNGAAGHDIASNPTSMWEVGAALARYGVTAFLPTIVSSGPGVVERARAVVLAGPPAGYSGASALGLHIEGPFLSPDRRGVHDPAFLRVPDPDLAASWSPERGVRLVTLAPELPGALELIRALVARGVVVSAGHSAATFEEAAAAIDAGITYATHLFNGMAPLDHRAPGLIGALLADDRVTVGMIADGVHVHPAVVGLVWRLVGSHRFSAVTDAVAALGMPPGAFALGGATLEADSTGVRSGGRLAGGAVGLDAVVRNVVSFTGASVEEAVGTVTSVPAGLLGLDGSRGTVRPGFCADLTLLTRDLDVAATIVRGRVAWADRGLVAWA